MDGQSVLITTKHRGVFIGTCKGDPSPERAVLTNARNVIYWSADTGGFGGLAVDGPGKESRLGSIMPEITLHDVTGIALCTDAAFQRVQEWPVWRG